MPTLGRATGQRIGPFGTLRSFVGVLREMSFDDIRDQAQTPPRLLVLAPEHATARRLGLTLTGPEGELAVNARELRAPIDDPAHYDAIVVHDPERSGAAERLRERLPTEGGPAPVFAFEGTGPEDAAAVERLRALIVSRLPDRAPAFGRAFPAFRSAAAKAIVDETAKANAQFALVSNIPAVIPIVGSLAAAGADFLVLTKNQMMMIYKIAAIHGRDLHDQWRIMRELLPVVGAGFVWRTVAREAASFVPLAAGTIPKVVIAYAGTLSAGRTADFYYRTNSKPTREQMHAYYRQAAEAVKKLPLPIPGGNGKEGQGRERPGAGGEQGRDAEALRPTEPAAQQPDHSGPPPGG